MPGVPHRGEVMLEAIEDQQLDAVGGVESGQAADCRGWAERSDLAGGHEGVRAVAERLEVTRDREEPESSETHPTQR